MAKTSRIRQVVDNTRSPEREQLSAAIQNHSVLVAALAENATNSKRTETSRWEAHRKVDAATKDVDQAKAADAEALAEGRAIVAAKAARAALTDSEDNLEAAKSAETMLAEQRTDLTNRIGIADSRVKEAVLAVVHNAPELRKLIEQFRAAQIQLHEMREAMQALTSLLPHASNAAWWEQAGLPTYTRFWDNVDWEIDLPPSETAASLRAWTERLRADADAVLEFGGL